MKRLTLYPFFFGLFVILAMYVANANAVAVQELFWPGAIVVAMTAALLGIAALIFRSFHRAALFTTPAVFMFLTYRQWLQGFWYLTKPLGTIQADVDANRMLISQGLLLVGIAYFAAFRVKQPRIWTMRLNQFGLVLLACPVIFGVGQAVWGRLSSGFRGSDSAGALSIHSQPLDQASYPDIYLIVADAHGRQDVLRDLYHSDDGPFLEHLRRKGFFVANQSHGNYAYTELSLASMLNMRFLDEFADAKLAGWDYVMPLLLNSTVVATLKGLGYRYITFQTVLQDLCFTNSDEFIRVPYRGGISNFHQLLLDTSLLSRFGGENVTSWLTSRGPDQYQEKRATILFELSQAPSVAALPGPKFVFLHLLCPHPAFVFAADGSDPGHRTYGSSPYGDPGIDPGYTGEMYRYAYARQAQFIDGQLSGVIDQILARSATPPIIILLGDHGPRSQVNWFSELPSDSNLQECMSNLTAIYFPPRAGFGGTALAAGGLYPSITPVNIFRLILNDYFDAKLTLLPDRVYFSCPWPFAFHDVTDAVRENPPLANAQPAANFPP
jgi:hypothetical protein